MPLHPTFQSLIDLPNQPAPKDPLDPDRKQARIAWARQAMARLKAANARDAAWSRLIADQPEEDDEALDDLSPPEQDEADAILAEIKAACDHDRWPRELYWSL
ncbi:hypothetical protein SCH01S_39_01350 [Sphingomonas changbaiensis NBRC 104936]|uniref:Uncharacterized protein n=1 Tax=Sphingomonas changbaiensis NBRC 104936 TaxID=1219043 RepID=A0A0E9MRT3_9SPHN|nr:hypothetical protein [Sphingomonas changbaiensis]GAO39850.1 hypothetical protein SCH01S_39_01350 [Sphingomonas changbaiensis NBRC 104936]